MAKRLPLPPWAYVQSGDNSFAANYRRDAWEASSVPLGPIVEDLKATPRKDYARENENPSARKNEPPTITGRGNRDHPHADPNGADGNRNTKLFKTMRERIRPWTQPAILIGAASVLLAVLGIYYTKDSRDIAKRQLNSVAKTLHFGAFVDYTVTASAFRAVAVFVNKTEGMMLQASGMVSFCAVPPADAPCSLDEVIRFSKMSSVSSVEPGGRMIIGNDPSNPETDSRKWTPALYERIATGRQQLFLYSAAKYVNQFGEACLTVACLRYEPTTGKLHYCPWPEHNEEKCDENE